MTEVDEPVLRSGLRELADRDVPGPLHVADLLNRARQRKSRRVLEFRAGVLAGTAAAATVAVLAVSALSGGGTRDTAGDPDPRLASGAPLTCPAQWIAPDALPTGHPGLAKSLLPGTPRTGLACQYFGRPVDPTIGPGAVRTVSGSMPLLGAQLKAVTDALHQPLVPSYPRRCPMTARGGVMVLFRYADAPDVYIEIPEVCGGPSNGALMDVAFHADYTLPDALNKLSPLMARPSQS